MGIAVPQAASSGGIPRSVTLLALALATFMQVLDTTIANVSMPTIAGNLGVSSDQGTWVITSFAVANGCRVPLTGWLMRRYGVVRTFVVSVLLFTAGLVPVRHRLEPAVADLLPRPAGRRLGADDPGIAGIAADDLSAEQAGTALAIWSMTTLVAPICGPILGGYISDNYSLGLDLPDQRAGGNLSCAFVCWRSCNPRDADAASCRSTGWASRCWWCGSARCR